MNEVFKEYLKNVIVNQKTIKIIAILRRSIPAYQTGYSVRYAGEIFFTCSSFNQNTSQLKLHKILDSTLFDLIHISFQELDQQLNG